MARATNDAWEYGSGCIVTSESSLAHTGSIVDDQCRYIIVTHFDGLLVLSDAAINKKISL